MTDHILAQQSTPNPFDDWRCIASAIFMALVGYTVMMGVPVLSTALVEKGGFSEVEVGRIWGADLGGFAIGAALSALLVGRINRRHLVWVGVALCVICNALCLMITDYEPLLFLRLGAGIASGIFTGIAVATMGGATRPVNVFNIEILAFAASTYLTLQFLPALVELTGWIQRAPWSFAIGQAIVQSSHSCFARVR